MRPPSPSRALTRCVSEPFCCHCSHYDAPSALQVDLEASVAHYRIAAESRSAQATFNLAYMYAHGLGLSRDYHLAKRHYDIAAETAAEAWAPVHLALFELKLMQWWEAKLGADAAGPYDFIAAHLAPFASGLAPAIAPLAALEADVVLILVLCAALGVVLILRQRQQLGIPRT